MGVSKLLKHWADGRNELCLPKKGRFEAREGWSEAEPFLHHGGM